MPWTSFSALFTSTVDEAITDGQPILATQIEALYNRSDVMLDWFKAQNSPYGMPGKINLFTSTSSEASIRIPSGADPTSPAVGDIWNNGGSLKFRSADGESGTKTLAFTDSSFTTITASGLVTANSLSVTTSSTFTGAATLNSTQTINVSNENALRLQTTSASADWVARVNTSTKKFELFNATSFSMYSNTTTEVFGVSGAGAVSAVSVAAPTIQTRATIDEIGITRITLANGLQRWNGSAWENFGTPEVVHTGGFTINIGNGVQAISATAQLPAVTIPYACSAVSWIITTNDTTEASLTGVTVSLKIQKRTSGNNNNSFTDVTGTTMELTTTTNSQASGTFTNVTFSQGDTLRLVATGTPTAKAVAVHIRVRRTA